MVEETMKDLVKSLTYEQRAELRILLGEDSDVSTVDFGLWPNGKLKWLTERRGKYKHGKSIEWYESGVKRIEMDYWAGYLDGPCVSYDESGAVICVEEWKMGLI